MALYDPRADRCRRERSTRRGRKGSFIACDRTRVTGRVSEAPALPGFLGRFLGRLPGFRPGPQGLRVASPWARTSAYLDSTLTRSPYSYTADWSVAAWSVDSPDGLSGVFVVDTENEELEIVQRQWNDERGEYEYAGAWEVFPLTVAGAKSAIAAARRRMRR